MKSKHTMVKTRTRWRVDEKAYDDVEVGKHTTETIIREGVVAFKLLAGKDEVLIAGREGCQG